MRSGKFWGTYFYENIVFGIVVPLTSRDPNRTSRNLKKNYSKQFFSSQLLANN